MCSVYPMCVTENLPYFSMYKTILLSKIFRLKIEGCLIHGSKLRREKTSGGEGRDQSAAGWL